MATREENLKKINEGLELMSDEELDQVAGGTVGELSEIFKAFSDNPFLKGVLDTGAHIPVFNDMMAKGTVGMWMKDKLGIEAKFHTGLVGTGFLSSKNEYTDMYTGSPLTHEQVIDCIKSYCGTK